MSIVPISHNANYLPATTLARNEWIELVRPAADLASQIANTDFVPREFRNKPDAITACVLYGAELGLGPMVSLSKIAVIQGRPAPYAELGRALALAAGHEIWIDESNNTRVTVSGKRKGSSHVQTVTWTHDDVKKAGINNQNYAKYPRQMLLARASAELVRSMCPDVLGGIAVFAEEAADIDDAPAPTTVTAPSESPPGTRKRSRPAKAAAPTTSPGEQPSSADADDREASGVVTGPTGTSAEGELDTDTDKPSDAQKRMAMALFKENGITETDDRHNATSALAQRNVNSWNDLTHDEASRVIDGLTRLRDGELTFNIDPDGIWTTEAVRDELFDD